MAKRTRGQIDISLITPPVTDNMEENESEDEVDEDEELIDTHILAHETKSPSSQNDPHDLPEPQQSFKDKIEFTKEMQKEIGLVIEECVKVLNKDPRQYHPFYVIIQKWLEIGLKLSYITKYMVSIIWVKTDAFAFSEFQKYNNTPIPFKKSDYSPQSEYLKYILNPQNDRGSPKSSPVEAEWKRILSSKTFSEKFLSSINTRLKFFQYAKNLTSPQDCYQMNFLWSRFFSSQLKKDCQPSTEPKVEEGQKKKESRKGNTSSDISGKMGNVQKGISTQEKLQAKREKERLRKAAYRERERLQKEKKPAVPPKKQTIQKKIGQKRIRIRNYTPEQKKAFAERKRIKWAAMSEEQREIESMKRKLRKQKQAREKDPTVLETQQIPKRQLSPNLKKTEEERNRLKRAAMSEEEREIESMKRKLRKQNQEKGQAVSTSKRIRKRQSTPEQKKAEAERKRLKRAAMSEEEKKAAKLKRTLDRKRNFSQTSQTKIKTDLARRRERRKAKTGQEKDDYLKKVSLRKDICNKHEEDEVYVKSLQYSSEDELLSEVEVETVEQGLSVGENFVFKSKSEFESEMEKVMTTIIQESVQVLEIDPREYHPFYVKLHLFIQAGLEQNFIDAKEVYSIWEKWDSTGMSQFSSKLTNSSSQLSIQEFENDYGPSPHLDLILFKRISPSTPKRSWSVTDREAQYQAITQQWRDILVDKASSNDIRLDLTLRIKLFHSCSSMIFLEDSSRMTKYWGKLFSGDLDNFEEKIKTRFSELQKFAEEKEEKKEEKKKEKKWEDYMKRQAWKASLTKEQKQELTQKYKMKYYSLTQEERKEKVKTRKERQRLAGEGNLKFQEASKVAHQRHHKMMEELKRENFQKWEETMEKKRKRKNEWARRKYSNKLSEDIQVNNRKKLTTMTLEERQRKLVNMRIYHKRKCFEKQVESGILTKAQMLVELEEATRIITKKIYSTPPKPPGKRQKRKPVKTQLAPRSPVEVMEPKFTDDVSKFIMNTVHNLNYIQRAPSLSPAVTVGEKRSASTWESLESSMSLELKPTENTEISASISNACQPRSPSTENFDDSNSGFDDDIEFDDHPHSLEPEALPLKSEINFAEKVKEDQGVTTVKDNHAPEASPNSPEDNNNDDKDEPTQDSDPTWELDPSKPEVPEEDDLPVKRNRKPRTKVSCPKCGVKLSSFQLLLHYEDCDGIIPARDPPSVRPSNRSKVEISSVPSIEPVSCPQCSQWFSCEKTLATHTHFAHGDGANPDNHPRCHLCFKSFRRKGTLDAHIRRVHEGKGFYCELCPNRGDLQCPSNLWKHKVSKHGLTDLPPPSKGKVTQCEFCGTTVIGRYFVHVKKKHPEMVGQVKIQIHKRKHSYQYEEKKKQCPECLAMFCRQYLQRHIESQHGKSHLCSNCNEKFTSKEEMMAHVESEHGNISDKLRTYNLVEFDSKLKGEEKWKCHLCGEKSISLTRTQVHFITSHNEVYEYLKTGKENQGNKKLKCFQCQQDFGGGSSLTEHYKAKHEVVLDEREELGQNCQYSGTKATCGICFEKKTIRTLDSHIKKVHKICEGLWECKDCDLGFVMRISWFKHRVLDHKDEMKKLLEIISKPNPKKVEEDGGIKILKSRKTGIGARKKKESPIKEAQPHQAASVRKSSRKVIRKKIIEESDTDNESEDKLKSSKVVVKVKSDVVQKEMKIVKVSLVRLTVEEIDKYRFKH